LTSDVKCSNSGIDFKELPTKTVKTKMPVQRPRSQGKGDGRRDNFKAFAANLDQIQKRDNPLTGKLFLRKNNRTVVKY
jgi:hypothetical protein